MTELLKNLCMIDGTSGDENAVRDFIINEIKDFCEYKVDNLGNIIVFKKGKKTPSKRVMIDAHLDEVGLIITSVTSDGFLRFTTVGGINTEVMLCRSVLINGSIHGIIGMRPVHLCSGDGAKKLPKQDSLYIDIGAKSKQEALKVISLGDRAVIKGDYYQNGDMILSKALDDRIGCAVLCSLIKEESEYDFYACFSTQEEVGLRGAMTAAHRINPDFAISIDVTHATTPDESKGTFKCGSGAVVCKGPNIHSSLVTEFIKVLKDNDINYDIEIEGGNTGTDAWAIQVAREGIPVMLLSLPLKYMHTPIETLSIDDCKILSDTLAKFLKSFKRTEDILCY